jgi:hypothetical protein
MEEDPSIEDGLTQPVITSLDILVQRMRLDLQRDDRLPTLRGYGKSNLAARLATYPVLNVI